MTSTQIDAEIEKNLNKILQAQMHLMSAKTSREIGEAMMTEFAARRAITELRPR